MAYQGGTEGGAAVADVLFGEVNPSGHLPVTWPRPPIATPGTSTPADHRRRVTSRSSSTSCPALLRSGLGLQPARYPFGFGLSYTTFQTSNLSVASSVSRRGTATATFTVANTGSRAGTEVVPVYVRQPVGDVVVPPRRLVGFTRVELDAGESRVVQVPFPVSVLAVTAGDIDGDGRPRVEPGSYQVQVGSLTADFTIRS